MVLQYTKYGSDTITEIIPEYQKAPVSFANNIVYDVDTSIYDATEVSMMQNMLFYKTFIDNLEAFSFIGVTVSQGRTADEYDFYRDTLLSALNDDKATAFIVNMGDFADNSYFDDWWKYFFDASKGTCKGLPLMTCIGNHELRGYGGIYYNLRFNNPQNAVGLADGYVSKGNDEVAIPVIEHLDNTVYSFDYGNAHFAVLNSGTDWSADQMVPMMELQKEWLDNDLASSDKQ